MRVVLLLIVMASLGVLILLGLRDEIAPTQVAGDDELTLDPRSAKPDGQGPLQGSTATTTAPSVGVEGLDATPGGPHRSVAALRSRRFEPPAAGAALTGGAMLRALSEHAPVRFLSSGSLKRFEALEVSAEELPSDASQFQLEMIFRIARRAGYATLERGTYVLLGAPD